MYSRTLHKHYENCMKVVKYTVHQKSCRQDASTSFKTQKLFKKFDFRIQCIDGIYTIYQFIKSLTSTITTDGIYMFFQFQLYEPYDDNNIIGTYYCHYYPCTAHKQVYEQSIAKQCIEYKQPDESEQIIVASNTQIAAESSSPTLSASSTNASSAFILLALLYRGRISVLADSILWLRIYKQFLFYTKLLKFSNAFYEMPYGQYIDLLGVRAILFQRFDEGVNDITKKKQITDLYTQESIRSVKFYDDKLINNFNREPIRTLYSTLESNSILSLY
ncbi:hypothetical protein AGLY_002550 [Aphis glycines]|uniref:Uncharacterized protein n=1 Tax=Aphis glycines TaxID=307491 RepID=A0A6G0U1Z0_APHGL|nr:hypothetical protein AGLY_002550 [Aphis glycines]